MESVEILLIERCMFRCRSRTLRMSPPGPLLGNGHHPGPSSRSDRAAPRTARAGRAKSKFGVARWAREDRALLLDASASGRAVIGGRLRSENRSGGLTVGGQRVGRSDGALKTGRSEARHGVVLVRHQAPVARLGRVGQGTLDEQVPALGTQKWTCPQYAVPSSRRAPAPCRS